MLKGFRDFVLRGNVVDLAVAVVIGTAFTALVKSLVADLITPLIAIPESGEAKSFSSLYFTVDGSRFAYGDFVNDVITFVLIAAVVYFLIVRPIESLAARRQRRQGDAAPETKDCPQCLTTIPFAARRCPACTSVLEDAA